MMRPDRIWEITPFTFVVQTWSSAFTWVAMTAMRQAAAKNHRTVDVLKNVVIRASFFRMMSCRPVIARKYCRTAAAKNSQTDRHHLVRSDRQAPRMKCTLDTVLV